jgi:hypothetical protein
MKISTLDLHSERGSATTKFLIILVLIVMAANAGYQYIPVAYQGASLKQEMDTAVVKGLAASGRMQPQDIVKAHISRAMTDYQTPSDAFVEIKSTGSHVQAHVAYRKQVDILPFGIYRYNYDFNYTAVPTGYLLKE